MWWHHHFYAFIPVPAVSWIALPSIPLNIAMCRCDDSNTLILDTAISGAALPFISTHNTLGGYRDGNTALSVPLIAGTADPAVALDHRIGWCGKRHTGTAVIQRIPGMADHSAVADITIAWRRNTDA